MGSKNAPTILVVDDEQDTVKLLSMNLIARNYKVITASDGEEALREFESHSVDLVLLDIAMPGLDGFVICQQIRKSSSVPIIILSARGRERDKVSALDLGADDYLTKPFSIEEMLARVRASLRRSTGTSNADLQRVRFGEFELDVGAHRLTDTEASEEVKLTRTEFAILSHLVRNAGKVVPHRALLTTVWGAEYINDEQYLWTYIRRLRSKLKDAKHAPRFIYTEPGVGYRFSDDTMKVS
ncbi:MAG: response regulator transcription factor [Chloroflexi bacterium]|nr:response regulator transcription factor [Chloroflexota bacterium]